MVAQTIPEDRPLTADDFMSLPMDDGHLYELLQGELILSPSPETNHQIISGNLYFSYNPNTPSDRSVWGRFLCADSPLSFRTLMSSNPTSSSFATISGRKLPDYRSTGRRQSSLKFFRLRIVEPDLQRKALLYAKAGVEEYWMVDPEKHRVLVECLTAAGVRHRNHHGRGSDVEGAARV